ncbi:molybdate ABC transporter substrate-binding protein [uncultured Schumannella sp.]|uniref:molybdate ABC transporter substrate-binding protein n=1 Tax=uncultured Schumannella sp. TaxID=1195956 RepID=UPI0025CBF17A|nr:molybdate ABC transporter substrate-binding protein [uncultured Schumannella sp.]
MPAPSDPSDPADGELAGSVTVLAAASLTEVFDDLAASFEAEHPGVDVVVSVGGSGALAEQILAGAPADVFAAANETAMATVAEAGLAPEATVFATNTLELVVPAGNPGGVAGLADLGRPELAIALCDETVPCGAASVELLALAGVTAAPDTLETDVKAVLTKVLLGEADAGLVYRTDVRAADAAVVGIEIAEASQVVNRYPIAALAEAPNPDAAQAFVAFVLSAAGRAALAEAGFGVP